MKILQICASYKPAYVYGGPIVSVSNLSEQAVKAGHAITVFTTTANGNQELAIPSNQPMMVDDVSVRYFKRLTKDHSHFSPALLWHTWRSVKNFDVVHIHAWWNTVSVLSALIAWLRGVPLVISPRGTLSDYSFHNRNSFYKTAIHNLLGKFLLQRSSIHVTSLHEQKALNIIIQPRLIFNIPNFIALPVEPIAGQKINNKKLNLLFFSRIEEKKGLDLLLHALTKVTVPFHLTIAGSGEAAYINDLKHIAYQNNLTAHISWLGFQSENKLEILAGHDLLVLPSHDENFGNVVIESLGVGTAVLISEHVGLADYVLNNSLGWVCKTEPNSIAHQINNVSKQQLDTIRMNSPALIYHDFNMQNMMLKYTDMYHQVSHHKIALAK